VYELTVIKQNGSAYIDSREVAEAIGKQHKHLLRDIRGYCEIMAKTVQPTFGLNEFFTESSYIDVIGRTLPCYLISKKGCEMVANKLTGEKGVLFTAAYVTRFNEMEATERESEIKANAKPRIGEFNNAVRNVLSGLAYCFASPKRVIGFLRGAYEPFGIEVKTDGDDSEYYTVTEIAAQLGIYSDIGNPHGHAVSAIISKLGNTANHAVAVPSGLVGVSLRYDRHIVSAVWDWIVNNGFPYQVPHLNFDYHIRYDCQFSFDDENEN
jgi:Rha family phage regulatory protein